MVNGEGGGGEGLKLITLCDSPGKIAYTHLQKTWHWFTKPLQDSFKPYSPLNIYRYAVLVCILYLCEEVFRLNYLSEIFRLACQVQITKWSLK